MKYMELPLDSSNLNLSYFNVMNSVAVVAGAVLGGVLIHHLPPLFGYSFLTLFLISFVARTSVMVFLAKKVREIRTRYV